MNDMLMNLFFLCSRYIHIVATAMIVGGTLFYEMVVPVAIGELKTEVQLAVFGRMRWVFRWVVYSSTIALLITGGVSAYRNYDKVLKGDFLSFLAERSPVRPKWNTWKPSPFSITPSRGLSRIWRRGRCRW